MTRSRLLTHELPMLLTVWTGFKLTYPTTKLSAEAPDTTILNSSSLRRKPIYDDFPNPQRQSNPPQLLPISNFPPSSSLSNNSNSTTTTTTSSASTTKNLTSLLTPQIRTARLFVHAHVSLAEDSINKTMSSALAHERSFTSTIASLAPPPQSKEGLLTGSMYVAVAGMSGSIITRNRNIFLRASVPVTLGIGAAWVVLPITMGNVSEFLWKWEVKKVPGLAKRHLEVRGLVGDGVREGKKVVEMIREGVEEGVRKGREGLEGLAGKGR